MLVCFSFLSNPNSFKIQAKKNIKHYFSIKPRMQAEHTFEIWKIPNLKPGKILLLPHLWGWTPPQRAPVWELCGLRSWLSGTGTKSWNACEKQRTCFNFKLLPSQLLSAFVTYGGGEKRDTTIRQKMNETFTGLDPFIFHPGQKPSWWQNCCKTPTTAVKPHAFLLSAFDLSF